MSLIRRPRLLGQNPRSLDRRTPTPRVAEPPELRRRRPSRSALLSNINEALDIWAEGVHLPVDLREGDLIALLNAGG